MSSPMSTNVALDSSEPRGLSSGTHPGYLGFTSFSAVYRETQNSLSLVQGPLADETSYNPVTTSPQVSGPREVDPADAVNAIILSPRNLENCLIVLQRIPAEDLAISLFNRYISPNEAWIRLASQRILKSLLSVFRRQLRARKPKDLERIARIFSENTSKTLHEEEPDPGAWIASFSGDNMRWECLGILFTYWAMASLAAHRSELQDSETCGENLTLIYQEAAELCIELCRHSAPNSLLQCLIYKVAIIRSILSGDAEPDFWRLHGQQIALATYLGMHAIPQDSSYVPTMSSEARRRLASQIFVIDKVAASFSGRPPLLSRKYMLTPLPLDLSDEVLLSCPETIASAVEALDEKGWNQDGKLYSATMVRARRMLASVKDEVMEVSLGNPKYTSTEALL